MKLYELFDAQERFQLFQLMNSSFATILAKQAKAGRQQAPKPIKQLPLPIVEVVLGQNRVDYIEKNARPLF